MKMRRPHAGGALASEWLVPGDRTTHLQLPAGSSHSCDTVLQAGPAPAWSLVETQNSVPAADAKSRFRLRKITYKRGGKGGPLEGREQVYRQEQARRRQPPSARSSSKELDPM